MLLKFVFKRLTLTLDKLTYELNFPFSEFETTNIKKKSKKVLELVKPKEIKDLEEVSAKTEQFAYTKSLEPQNIIKKQEVKPENLTSVQSDWGEFAEKEQKLVINYSELLEHRTEILARKDIIHQIWLTMKVGGNY